MTLEDEHWATSFYLDVPAGTRLSINTNNGGISIEEFRGTAVMRAKNAGSGCATLAAISEDTHRMGLAHRADRPALGWPGARCRTRNGGVRLTLPADYSAELETGTVNGRVNIDFPVTIHPGRQRLFTATRDRAARKCGPPRRMGASPCGVRSVCGPWFWHFLCSPLRTGRDHEQGKGSDRLHPDVADGRARDIAVSDFSVARVQLSLEI
jgi:hypothetical protein